MERYYKNKILCGFYKECMHIDCINKLTEEVRKDATKKHMPIWEYNNKPRCFKNKKEK